MPSEAKTVGARYSGMACDLRILTDQPPASRSTVDARCHPTLEVSCVFQAGGAAHPASRDPRRARRPAAAPTSPL
jgi:hypothetical protein